MTAFQQAKINMVKGQILPTARLHPQLLEAIIDIPRELFLPEKYAQAAYIDQSIPVTKDRFLMAPSIFCQMLAALSELFPQAEIAIKNILDIGCVTGYSSAIFANIAEKVIAVESETALASRANQALHKLSIHNVITISGPLNEGYPEAGPFAVIFINGVVREIPESLIRQMDENGILVTAVAREVHKHPAMHAVLGTLTILKKCDGQILRQELFPIIAPLLPLS